ncbi:MAG: hypothetical protein AAB340_03240 [Patescibacteria group bacterium]
MSDTSSDFPDWYINFQSAILKQLPRPDQLDQDVAEGWDKNQKYLKDVLAGVLLSPTPKVVSSVQKFEIFKNLGILTVPANYIHTTRLADFYERHQGGEKKSFYYYNSDINDQNFANPSRILKPGEKFQVDVVRQVSGEVTSEEHMAFLAVHRGIHLGAQGASLVFDDQKMRADLPKGKWHFSFDEKARLWQDAPRYHRVPGIYAGSDGGFSFRLGYFARVWYDDDCFFFFRDS